MGPILSMDHASAIQPWRLTRPKVGRRPVAPHRVDGLTMLPSVSLPRLNPTSPATVAAAGPALEPLDPSIGFHGLFVRPPNQTSPYASAPTLRLANRTAPASSNRFTDG